MTFEPSVISGLIAAATPAPAPKAGAFDPTAFDFVVLVVLLVGLIRGRKRGMSEELLEVLQWLLMVVLGSMFYEVVGKTLAPLAGMGLLWSYIISYLAIILAVKIAFTMIKRAVGEKLIGSDLFGRAEYYLGMAAGMVRFACMLLVGLALLRAPYISPAEVEANRKKQEKELGSTFFPSFGDVQQQIFFKSIVGPLIRDHMADQLIKPTPVGGVAINRDQGPGKKRERAVDDAVNGPAKK